MPGFCADCPLRSDGQGVEMSPPARFERLKAMVAAGEPVTCHHAVDLESAAEALAAGRDWRLDSRVVVACGGLL